MEAGKVYLVGGGCGDAGLVTCKGLEIIRNCEAVVYDSLAPEELLHCVREDCEKIYVGKRYGSHAMKQADINALLAEKAREGKTVARLKGGDPYVFGRGGEEFLAMKEAGVCCEEIPGISSAIAVPAAAGIPVTHRGLSASVTIVTGTTAEENGDGGLKLDYGTLARLDGTLVILMGMHHLQEIAAGLMTAGKSPETPCAVIMEGTTPRQKCMRTVLSRLAADAAEQGFTSPAVIVVGAVAGLELTPEWGGRIREEGQSCIGSNPADREGQTEVQVCHGGGAAGQTTRHRADSKILAGVTVGITGTPHFVKKLSAAAEEQGADVWDMGFMEIRESEAPLPEFEDAGWLVFTSPNGARIFLDKMKEEHRDLRTLWGKRLAVIGPGTAAVLEEAGLYADYIPEIYDAAHLAQGLAERILTERQAAALPNGALEKGRAHLPEKVSAVFLRAKEGSPDLPLIFANHKIPFLEYPLYELGIQEEKRAMALAKKPDYIVFGSAMGVRAYFEGREQTGIGNGRSRYVCIGERCREEFGKYMALPCLVAKEASVSGIVECLCRDVLGSIGDI